MFKYIQAALIVATSLACSSCGGGNNEAEAVKDSFNNYKTAILNDKGDEAVNYVDSRTISYYTGILDKVKNADSATVDKLSILDKLNILMVRHRATREEIHSFDGKGLIVYAIRKGMVGKNGVNSITIGKVDVDGDFANGELVADGKPAPYSFHFYKEQGKWKIDLTSIFAVSEQSFKNMMEQSGQAENEYLVSIVEMTGDRQAPPDIWQPAGKQE